MALARTLFIFPLTILSLISLESLRSSDIEEKPPAEPLGLKPVPWPKDNHYSASKAELGRLLYFDKRLSADGTISCASCHKRECGFSDCKEIAVGINDHLGTRHSPTIINSAYYTHYFWDGRVDSLEEQCKGPIANTKEMAKLKDAHEAHRECVNKVKSIAGYQPLFKKAFGVDQPTMNEIAQAIATFERTILSGNSPYDRYKAGDASAMTAEEIKGMAIYKKTGCINCHGGFNFSDDRFHNIGVGMDQKDPDPGRSAISGNPKDFGAFKTPTLRDTANAAPYMHDGSLKTLEAVVEFYDKGGVPNKNLHPLIRPLHLSQEEKAALVSFLKALSGEGWQHVQEPGSFPQ